MNIKKLWLFVLSFLAVTNLVACSNTTTTEADSNMEAFAQCLTEKWITMYGTATCPYCQKQKEMFWDAFEKIDYVDCLETPDICTEQNIQWIPAWIFADRSMKQGLQDLEVLAELAGCTFHTEDTILETWEDPE